MACRQHGHPLIEIRRNCCCAIRRDQETDACRLSVLTTKQPPAGGLPFQGLCCFCRESGSGLSRLLASVIRLRTQT